MKIYYNISALIILLGLTTLSFAKPLKVEANYYFKPHTLKIVKPLLNEIIQHTRLEQGNIKYQMTYSSDPNHIIFHEIWSSTKTHEQHINTPYFKKTHKILSQYYSRPPVIKETGGGKANTLYQVATIGSLARGVYDSNIHYASLFNKGTMGLGTFKAINGEMVAVDGQFFQIKASGKLVKVSPKQVAPFAEIVNFKPTHQNISLSDVQSYQQLDSILFNHFKNHNIPYAIRIDGTFSHLKLRSLRKQTKPYPPLTVAAENQAIFNLNHVKGSIVGFWFPQYWTGIAVPGYHLHFVTADRKIGGHVLGIDLKQASLSFAPIYHLAFQLPTNQSFAKANLDPATLHQAIHKAEGGAK